MPPPCNTRLSLSRSRSGRACLLAAVLVILLGLRASGLAQCEAPLHPHCMPCSSGTLSVCWFHPTLYADTIRAFSGDYVRSFSVGRPDMTQRIAIRLPIGGRALLIRSLACYVVGSDGVSDDQWSLHASLIWGFHADEEGRPGPLLIPESLWNLADFPHLRQGGWVHGVIDWAVPEETGDLWLVATWPEAAANIVELGADDGAAALPTLVGLDSGDGNTDWQSIWSPGLLLGVSTLSSTATISESVGESLTFSLVTQVLDGPLAGSADTTIVLGESDLHVIDSAAVTGQLRCYRVQTLCDGDSSESIATEPFALTAHWPVTLTPTCLTSVVPSGWCEPLQVGFANDGDTALFVTADLPIELFDNNLALGGTCSEVTMSVEPDSLWLPAHQEASLQLAPADPLTCDGTFSGFLRLHVGTVGSDWVDNYLVPIDLTVDAVTLVDGAGEGGLSIEQEPMTVRPLTSPFGDQIRLRVTFDGSAGQSLDGSPASFAAGGGDAIEVAVFDILGRERARNTFPAPSVAHREGNEAIDRDLVISRTGEWSSGVYFSRVRWGPYVSVVKLLHLR